MTSLEKKIRDYAYYRGYLDGSGHGDRATGKTSKAILQSILYALHGDNVILTTSGSHQVSLKVFDSVVDVIEALSLGYEARFSNSRIVFPFGGSVWVINTDLEHSLEGIDLRNYTVMEDD